MAMVLVLGSFAMAFASDAPAVSAAGDENQIQPRNVNYCTIEVERLSSTSGRSIVDCTFSGRVEWATCDVTLQEKSGSSWVTATGVSPTSASKTVYDTNSLYMVSYWDLISGKTYRVKVVLKDKINSVTYTNTYYSDPF